MEISSLATYYSGSCGSAVGFASMGASLFEYSADDLDSGL